MELCMGDYPDLEKNRTYNFLLNLPDIIKNLSDTNLQMVVHFAIIELEDGVEGNVANEDISWTRKINHPSEVLKKGRSVEVLILEADFEEHKLVLGMKQLMEKHDARGISINCLGGFYKGHLKAFPCLGFSQFNDDGLVGGCEADQMSALTMATMGAWISTPIKDQVPELIIRASSGFFTGAAANALAVSCDATAIRSTALSPVASAIGCRSCL